VREQSAEGCDVFRGDAAPVVGVGGHNGGFLIMCGFAVRSVVVSHVWMTVVIYWKMARCRQRSF
jgi:hypothetical protein